MGECLFIGNAEFEFRQRLGVIDGPARFERNEDNASITDVGLQSGFCFFGQALLECPLTHRPRDICTRRLPSPSSVALVESSRYKTLSSNDFSSFGARLAAAPSSTKTLPRAFASVTV